MDRGSLACGVSPRQGLRPHSPNTSSVNQRVSRYFDTLIFCILQAGSRGLWYHSSRRPKTKASSPEESAADGTASMRSPLEPSAESAIAGPRLCVNRIGCVMCVCDASHGGGAGLLFIFPPPKKEKQNKKTERTNEKKRKKKCWARLDPAI